MKQFMRLANEAHNLCPSFHRRLNCYALQAGAAGVSLLALAQPSEAKIVYTRTHHVIGNGDSYNLDLNHDGITDLTLQNEYHQTCTHTDGSCRTYETLATKLARDNQVVYNVGFGAVAIKPGFRIGARDAFDGGLENMAKVSHATSEPWGSWINVKNRYLGLKFKIAGETHYGWARLSVQVQFPLTITATLTGYAYETVPNKSIVAGQTEGTDEGDGSIRQPQTALGAPTPKPGTLGLLAMGSSGLSIWRREELAGVAE